MLQRGFLTLLLLVWIGAGELPPIRNIHQVNDHIYRGAQPTPEGFKALQKMGIKTVIDLRDSRVLAQDEKRLVESLGMQYVSVPMRMHAPTDEEIARVLAVLNQNGAGPIFIHCLGGRDRTGTAIACYRIEHDGWDNRKAFDEAIANGLGAVDLGMRQYILRYRPPANNNHGSK
jgi:tyrosine-protein phosphatase SIW14